MENLKTISTRSLVDASEELCKICGDKATGCNFQVITCDSCRSFFRRCEAEKQASPVQCPFNGDCKITKQSRRFCRACRLQKCLMEGMRHENSAKTLNTSQSLSLKPSKVAKTKSEVAATKELRTKCTCKCQCGFYSPDVELVAASQPVVVNQSSPDIMYSSPHSSSTVQTLSPNCFFPVELSSKELNKIFSSEDQFLLEELVSANSVLKAPMELTLKELDTSSEITLLSVVRISDLAMRRIISMAKLLSSFQRIQQCDQIALLKGGLSELLILRGVMCFDATENTWAHHFYKGSQNISLHVDVLKWTPEEQHYEIHRNFLHTFDERWRKDETLMLLLNAIVLFSFDRSNIKDVMLVRQTQQLYISLLERYLQSECSLDKAAYDYQGLMQQLLKLRDVNRSLQLVYNRLNPDDLEPLLKELFASS